MRHITRSSQTKDVILKVLLDSYGNYVPGGVLADTSGVSRAGVWKHIASLRAQGFRIQASIKKGYCLGSIPDRLFPSLVSAGLETQVIGREVHYFHSLDSTNRVAKEYALSGVSDGAVVVAEKQTKGKGRLNRTWISSAYSNILCSIIFYPTLKTSSVFRVTMLASVALARALARTCGVDAKIKWPNDVYINGKKSCGILTEFLADHDRIIYVVVGIGINVNFDVTRYPELKDSATSLKMECGEKISRLTIFKALLEEIDFLYQDIGKSGGTQLRKEWDRYSMVMNQQVKIISGNDVLCGVAKGINDDGHLILIDHRGRKKEILCGDLSLRMDS